LRYTLCMFISVQLLNGFPEPLWYAVPTTWQQSYLVGTIVRVPLKNRTEQAVVLRQQHSQPSVSFNIRPALNIESVPTDPHYHSFIQKLAWYYRTKPIHLIKRIRMFVGQKEKDRKIDEESEHSVHGPILPPLTDEQQTTYQFVADTLHAHEYAPTVLHGVTGSGKTEIYKRLLCDAITHQQSALLLLPEVTLALQFERLLRTQLPHNIIIRGFHSATSIKHKREMWQALLDKQPQVIIGVHMPLLLPLPHLGIIIIDEEHEAGYQEKKHPKINTVHAALMRAQLHRIPILLGSATPSLNSLYNVKHRGWHFFELKKRFAGAFPTIKTVLLSDKKRRRNFWISNELEEAITDRLAKKEQVIIFLNRRGFSFFVQCKICSFIFECTSCSVSLTLHNEGRLTCHYCGYTKQLPTTCPSCSADEKKFLKKGVGTQRIVTILQKLFPFARIARADMDTTSKKKHWQQTVKDFERGNIDILVGTQSITKGYHFPNVTLVGILWADLQLHVPHYRASETALQQLIQVAGRAGRQHAGSLVIVQAMADHHLFSFIDETKYMQFYEYEIQKRALLQYPPAARLVAIELKHRTAEMVEQESDRVAQQLHQLIADQSASIILLGPAKPPVHKIQQIETRIIYLKGSSLTTLYTLCDQIEWHRLKSTVYFTPLPQN